MIRGDRRVTVDSVAAAIGCSHGPLKTHLGGRHFANDAEVECEVKMWFRKQSTQFYAAGLGGLIKRWDKCINVGGNYVEK